MTTLKELKKEYEKGPIEPPYTFPVRGNNFDLFWRDEYTTAEDVYAESRARATTYYTEPILEGFEQVIGRKFTCFDCDARCDWRGVIDDKPCKGFHLSDNTKAEIRLRDKEIDDTKIDTHPRHFVSNDVHYYIKQPVIAFMTEFKPQKLIIRQAQIKLELIL